MIFLLGKLRQGMAISSYSVWLRWSQGKNLEFLSWNMLPFVCCVRPRKGDLPYYNFSPCSIDQCDDDKMGHINYMATFLLLSDSHALIIMKVCLLWALDNVPNISGSQFSHQCSGFTTSCLIGLFSELSERLYVLCLTQGLTKNICSMEEIMSILF